jgi:uncharacterized protein YbbC (DUF1343 family)
MTQEHRVTEPRPAPSEPTGIGRRRFLGALAATAAGAAAGPGLAGPAQATVTTAGDRRGRSLRTGFEVLQADGYRAVRGEKVGIITNPTGVTRDMVHQVDVMAASDQVHLAAVFGPEHGFRGTAQAGGSEGFYTDERTGLPVYDTYLKSGQPLADILARSGVDTVLFDIQDAGARFYTYIWTLYDAMEAAAMSGKRFVVLDRPNPLSGRAATGPVLQPAFATFIGRKAIPQQHGMTVAELAWLFNDQFLPAAVGTKVDLRMVRMTGWERDELYADSGLHWVLPSPNMPTPTTALVYPGTGMFEGTNLSEGRGTTRPFELIGAPYVDHKWADALRGTGLAGVQFREAYFAPTFSKWVGRTVGGVQLHVTDPSGFDAVRTATVMIVTAKMLYPQDFAWRSDNWIDKLTGSTRFRTMVDDGASTDEVVAAWQPELAEFEKVRGAHLLYGRRGGRR